MNRLEGCPLNKTCEKTKERFYRHKKDLRSCKNYWGCKILTSAWKLPIERHYDLHGQYLEVCTAPIISEWWEESSYSYPEVRGKHCRAIFLSQDHTIIGSWFDRPLTLPTPKDLEDSDFLELEKSVAMEIRQTYHYLGFVEAVRIRRSR
ncbi:MAG: hypothetical protein ACRC1Z_00565 [Waterburya sp.]